MAQKRSQKKTRPEPTPESARLLLARLKKKYIVNEKDQTPKEAEQAKAEQVPTPS